MAQTSLLNLLRLSFSPMTVRHLQQCIDDPYIHDALSHSRLYVIAQRPMLAFDGLDWSEKDGVLSFEITQLTNDRRCQVRVNMYQPNFELDQEKEWQVVVGQNQTKSIEDVKKNIHGLRFEQEGKFIMHWTPDHFLYNYVKGDIECLEIGEFRFLLHYNVHYVGKAIRQDVWKRLKNHSTLQEILSLENPMVINTLPAHEVVLLFFEFEDNLSFTTIESSDSGEDIHRILEGQHLPTETQLYSDAEMALINGLQPTYNRRYYKNYPKGQEGLHSAKLRSYSYTFANPITLHYADGEIRGGLHNYGGDSLIVSNGRLEVSKHNP